jgi:methionine-rich copper-binding protein CopC
MARIGSIRADGFGVGRVGRWLGLAFILFATAVTGASQDPVTPQALAQTQAAVQDPVAAQDPAQNPVTAAQAAAAAAAPGAEATEAAQSAAPAVTDTDHDGMPDDWETFFGLNPTDPLDATGDPDGDGLTNLQEFQANSHPVGKAHRYFAEGATGFFTTSIGLFNPSSTTTAAVLLSFVTEQGVLYTKQVSLAPRRRSTVSVNSAVPAITGVSTHVESNIPVAADRFMRWGLTSYGSSLDSGVESPSTTWYFSEGATGPFALYYLLLNPGSAPAHVSITYLPESGSPITKTHTVAPHTRKTVFVNTESLGLLVAAVGAAITSDVPIVAERAMYLSSLFELFGAGGASTGTATLSKTWYFAEGATGPFFDEYILLANPSPTVTVDAEVTFRRDDGTGYVKHYTVVPQTRRTIWINQEASITPALAPLATGPVSVAVNADQPIVAERSMWWARGAPWYEVHASLGTPTPGPSWMIAEAAFDGPTNDQTFLLISNTSALAGTVRVTSFKDDGTSAFIDLAMTPFSRKTVEVGSAFHLANSRVSLLVQSQGATPLPTVVDYVRYSTTGFRLWNAGGAASAIPLAVSVVDTAPTVTSTTPTQNATNVSRTANLSVTFSEPVNVTASAFTLECPAATPITLANLTASPATTFTLDPAVTLPLGVSCVLKVHANQVTDTDTVDPPDQMASDFTLNFSTAGCPTITVTPASLTPADVGVAYGPVQFLQSGGTTPIAWSLTGGALPAGMSFNASGVLSGTPTATGTFTFTVTATDADGCTGTVTVTLSVSCPAITVAPSSLGPANVGVAYTPVTFTATGSPAAVTFALTSGTLPTGMSLTSGGLLSGTPTAAGTYTFTVTATDANGCSGSVTVTLSVTCPAITVSPGTLTNATAGAAYAPVTFTASGAPTAVTFAVTSGTLPAGMTLTSGGLLSGTPTATGTFSFTVTATDANGCSGAVSVTLQVLCPTITVTPTTLTNATVGSAYAPVTFAQTGGVGTTTFSVTGGALPAGMTLSSAGVLSGTPTAAGTASFTVTATDANGCTGTVTVTLDVQCPTITVTPATLPDALGGVAYSQLISVTGGTAPHTWSASGALPAGVTFNTGTHTLAGTPTQTGTFPITITATDVNACSGAVTTSLKVLPNAVDDAYPHGIVGNVGVDSSLINYSVLTNDVIGGTPGIATYDALTAAGGTVVMTMSGVNAGKFTYNPPAGYEGPDSFTYTATNGSDTDTATVSLVVGGMVWFINNNAGACVSACDGRLSNPFTSLATFQAANDGVGNHPANADNVFLYEGASAYTGPVVLRPSQRLIGQDASASISTITGLVPGASSASFPATNSGNGTFAQISGSSPTGVVQLGTNNLVRGLRVSTTAGGAVGIRGTSFGTFTASESQIAGSGAAVELQNGTLAATFTSIASSAAAHGIQLTSTTGTFAVTGTAATPGSGGTISGATDAGVILSSAAGVTLNFMNVQGSANEGIRGATVNGFAMTGTTVSNNGNVAGEAGVELTELTGTVGLTGVTVTGSAEDNMNVKNTGGTLTMTVVSSTFSSNSSIGSDGLLLDASGTATITATITGSTFTANKGDHFQAAAANDGNLNIIFTGNTLTGGHATALGQGITINAATGVPGYTGDVKYNISNNSINGAILSAINVNLGTSAASATFQGKIDGNQIGTVGQLDSCSTQAHGIALDSHGNGTHTSLIQNNTVRQCFDRALNVLANDGGGTLHLTVQNNSFTHSDGTNSRQSVFVETGATSTNVFGQVDHHFVCLDLGSGGANTLQVSAENPPDGAFRVRQRFESTLRLPGYAGANNDNAAAIAFLSGLNGAVAGTATNDRTTFPAGGGFVGGAACNAPVLP